MKEFLVYRITGDMKGNSSVILEKGTLWGALVKTTEHAVAVGALLPIPTEYEFLEDRGVRFFVRILVSLARKDEERKRQQQAGVPIDPFLPYEEDLFVADISGSHVAVLNKFNVLPHHLLIVTREFQDQDTLLTTSDFEALRACLSEYDGLGFYNGGEAAGASQSHKHLQVVPLPLAPEGPRIPIEPLLEEAIFKDGFGTIKAFPFRHVFMRFGGGSTKEGEGAFSLYSRMLRYVGMRSPAEDRLERQSGPYCLLVTREWMLLVPRSVEFFDGISVNSLGYAGALLVRDEKQLKKLSEFGPMNMLKIVGLPPRVC